MTLYAYLHLYESDLLLKTGFNRKWGLPQYQWFFITLVTILERLHTLAIARKPLSLHYVHTSFQQVMIIILLGL